MSQAREEFYRTTEQYFQTNHKINLGINLQSENQSSESETRKFYIKEGPFINYTKE